MTTLAYRIVPSGYSSAVPASPTELFPASIESVFNRLEAIATQDDLYEPGEVRPSSENIEWAKRVLLRVLPRHYLNGAEIDTFHGEIHVTWENGAKRVVAFLPAPNELKLYCEQIGEQGAVDDHHLRSGNDPWVIGGVLRWLYQ